MTNLINDTPFLDGTECEDIVREVFALQTHWTSRSIEGLPFYTLGTASYLDARPQLGGMPRYIEEAKKSNPRMRVLFGQLYELVLSKLGYVLQEPCYYPPDMGLPGFHIFQACEEFLSPLASKHSDRQFEFIKWRGNVEDTFSFTLPLSIPTSGAGLTHWVDERDFYWPYKVGTMVYFFGLIQHQIAPFKKFVAGEYRITLQGHAVRINKRWLIYW